MCFLSIADVREKLQEGMGGGFHHIIAIYGHEMAFLPQRCPFAMPRPALPHLPGPHCSRAAAAAPWLVGVRTDGNAAHRRRGVTHREHSSATAERQLKADCCSNACALASYWDSTTGREKLSRRKWKCKPRNLTLGSLN